MDTELYEIRRDLSRALSELREAQRSYPDDPTLHAIDNLQSAVERLTDALEEIRQIFAAHGGFPVPRPVTPATSPVESPPPRRHGRR